MTTAKGRAWKRLIDSGRATREQVFSKVSTRSSKSDLLDCAYALSVDVDASATKEQIYQALENAVNGE